MDSREATRTLEVIRTLMERTTQYQFLTARAGLAAGLMACVGSTLFLFVDAANPWAFAIVWSLVFAGSLLVTCICTVLRVRERGEQVWSRQAQAVVLALAPSVFAALVLSIFFLVQGWHLWLPGVWMLCYGQGSLATAVYAPPIIRTMGLLVLVIGGVTLGLGPTWAILMMALVFGLGHIWVGLTLLATERRGQRALGVFRTVA
jgi:hypothetical protein